ncbi:MAG TPA: NAD(P)-binding domain-containing protein, partial [Ignavibacteria bacterium]|nr:NAD(P)-binding domain-containing protein [Ignavibacteria bacterium]
MKLGLIGLGKMGANMTERLLKDNHDVVVYDLNSEAVKHAEQIGASGSVSLNEMVSKLDKPCVIWVMVPAGNPVQDTINKLIPLLSKGDIIIDGGNSYYKDTRSRGEVLQKHGIHFLDAGTSGGVWG